MSQDNRDKLIAEVQKMHELYKEFFSDEKGQLILKDLRKRYYINRSCITNVDDVNPINVSCKEAQRAVILYIENMASDKQLKQLGVNEDSKDA